MLSDIPKLAVQIKSALIGTILGQGASPDLFNVDLSLTPTYVEVLIGCMACMSTLPPLPPLLSYPCCRCTVLPPLMPTRLTSPWTCRPLPI